MRYIQETRCLNCGRVLTDVEGKRWMSAMFGDHLPTFPPTKERTESTELTIIWARCEPCHDAA